MNGNVLITGVNRGLGEEMFRLFISKGYTVYGIVRNENEAEKLISTLPKNGRVILADLSKEESICSIQSSIGDEPIDLLINNAGVGGSEYLLDNVQSKEILDLFNIHCLGVFRTIKALKVNLARSNEPIVLNMNSRLGSITKQGNGTYDNISVSYSYGIAKAAQNMLTNFLRSEFMGEIKFISIHPGKMKTKIAQIDADTEPIEVAIKILQFYERGTCIEENGIVELGKELIEW